MRLGVYIFAGLTFLIAGIKVWHSIRFGDSDPLAFLVGLPATIIAICALELTLRENRRNNTPIVTLVSYKGQGIQYPITVGAQVGPQFSIVLRNEGITLWNVAIHLEFHLLPSGSSRTEFSLMKKDDRTQANDKVEFARGMMAEYVLDWGRVRPDNCKMYASNLARLKDFKKQRTSIVIQSQGFDACSIPIGSWSYKSKRVWNWFASQINWWFEAFEFEDSRQPAQQPPKTFWEKVRRRWSQSRLAPKVATWLGRRPGYYFEPVKHKPTLEFYLAWFIREIQDQPPPLNQPLYPFGNQPFPTQPPQQSQPPQQCQPPTENHGGSNPSAG